MNLSKHFKGEKLNIHMFYWILILLLTTIVLFTTRAYSNESLAEQVAFGATLSGIILSVIAIIMTLIGETKSDNTKDKLLNLSEDLEKIVNDIKNTTSNLEGAVQSTIEVKDGITKLNNSMDQMINLSKDKSLSNQELEEKSLSSQELEDEKYYLTVFKLFVDNLNNDDLKKPIFVSFTYTYLKLKKSSGKISFKIFCTDMSSLKSIDLNNECTLSILWGMNGVFSRAFRFSEFGKYIEDHLKANYTEQYDEIVEKLN
ncbi:TPA: hypothetical protein I9Z60_001568 [Clostridium perfringens]|nr:hypothetical protein [Clostridium perfringens]